MKKLFLLALTALCLVGVTACQGGQNDGKESSVTSPITSGFELPEDKFN